MVQPVYEKGNGNRSGFLNSNKNPFYYIISGVLIIALIVLGVLYGVGISKLNTANTQIAELTADIDSIESRLLAEKDNVRSLQSQLIKEQANLAALQTDLTSTQFELVASQTKVDNLTGDLAEAEAIVVSLQSELDATNLELTVAIATNISLTDNLEMVQNPQHFNSLGELTAWLGADDTNTNPDYSSLTSQGKAYILQVKALRDGYILSACIDWDSNFIYSWNVAVIGSNIYSVNADTDAITAGPAFDEALPLHPLPLT